MSDQLQNSIFALALIFFLLVVPLWLLLHYRSRYHRKENGLSDEQHKHLMELKQSAEQLAERISVLESILDDEMPDWRRKESWWQT